MTTWRIYHAHVERLEDSFSVTTYNMFGREVDQDMIIDSADRVREQLKTYADIEPKFTSNWSF